MSLSRYDVREFWNSLRIAQSEKYFHARKRMVDLTGLELNNTTIGHFQKVMQARWTCTELITDPQVLILDEQQQIGSKSVAEIRPLITRKMKT